MIIARQTRALFLDRDGVINLDLDYLYRPEQVVFVDGIFDLCRYAYGLNYRIVVVTNQSGIGRGYFSEADFHALTVWMKNIFSQQGCPITAVYFCPYHPTAGLGGYRRESSWRKPAPGMILAAAQDLDLDLANSILVGDRLRDIAAGEAAGVRCNLLYGESVDDNSEVRPTARVSSLREIRPYLL
jgi:D-glycero-D-manno-heptose 1,7-bisphosphate phosphatase